MTIIQAGAGAMRGGITCRAGEVTVLRAFTESALRPFQQQFAAGGGAQPHPVFEALSSGQRINPADVTPIGFARDFTDPSQRLWEFMHLSGIPAEHVPHLLTTYNFPHSEELCINLQPQYARVARILAASYQAEKILVLNDPFAPLTAEWRERLAEFIATQARSMQQIVLVTSLSSRPQCWIGNELISRVQIEESFNMTIGHGGSAAHLRSLVDQVRLRQTALDPDHQSSNSEQRTNKRTAGILTAPPDESEESLNADGWLQLAERIDQFKRLLIGSSQWGPFHSAALAFAVACCFFALKLWSSGQPAETGPTAAPAVERPLSPVQKAKRVKKAKAAAVPPQTIAAEAAEAPAAPDSVLDSYPPEIKQSILLALSGFDQTYPRSEPAAGSPGEIKAQRSVKNTKRRRRSAERRQEQQHSSSDDYGSAAQPGTGQPALNNSGEDWELVRREQRERFLAAIRAGGQVQPAEDRPE